MRLITAGDLAISGRKFVVVEGIDYIRQKLLARFQFFLGEWFLDLREGVPYYRDVFVANPDKNMPVIRSLLKRIALSVPGVVSIRQFDVVFDSTTRSMIASMRLICNGGTLVVTQAAPFIIDLAQERAAAQARFAANFAA